MRGRTSPKLPSYSGLAMSNVSDGYDRGVAVAGRVLPGIVTRTFGGGCDAGLAKRLAVAAGTEPRPSGRPGLTRYRRPLNGRCTGSCTASVVSRALNRVRVSPPGRCPSSDLLPCMVGDANRSHPTKTVCSPR